MPEAADLAICLHTLTADPWSVRPADTDRLIAAVGAAGFGSVGMFSFFHSAVVDASDPGRTGRTLAEHGVGLAMLDACTEWVNGVDGAESDAVSLRVAGEEGAPIMGAVCMAADLPAGPEAAMAGLARLADVAAESGVSLAVEFLPWTALPDLRTAWALVEAVGRPNVGINLDTWHWFRRHGGTDPSQLDGVPIGRLLVLQLEDVAPVAEADLMDECMHRRPLPGQGTADLVGLLTELRLRGADPVVMPEVFNDHLAAGDPVVTAGLIRDACLEVLTEAGW